MAIQLNRPRNTNGYRSDSAAAGAVAGIIAGACMALVCMLVSAAAGLGFWHPLALMGGIFYGVEAILDSIGHVVTGLITQLILTSSLGALFGYLLPRRHATTGKATGWGILFGAASWGFVTFMILPVFNQTMKDRVDLAPGWWFLSFLVFGFALGITPTIRQSIGRDVEVTTFEETRRAA